VPLPLLLLHARYEAADNSAMAVSRSVIEAAMVCTFP
jgi:hypothetical protein